MRAGPGGCALRFKDAAASADSIIEIFPPRVRLSEVRLSPVMPAPLLLVVLRALPVALATVLAALFTAEIKLPAKALELLICDWRDDAAALTAAVPDGRGSGVMDAEMVRSKWHTTRLQQTGCEAPQSCQEGVLLGADVWKVPRTEASSLVKTEERHHKAGEVRSNYRRPSLPDRRGCFRHTLIRDSQHARFQARETLTQCAASREGDRRTRAAAKKRRTASHTNENITGRMNPQTMSARKHVTRSVMYRCSRLRLELAMPESAACARPQSCVAGCGTAAAPLQGFRAEGWSESPQEQLCSMCSCAQPSEPSCAPHVHGG